MKKYPPEFSALTKEEFFQKVREEENVNFVMGIMEKISDDRIKSLILKMLSEKKLEIRSFLSWLALHINPKTYLEVGVRRGFSTAVVAGRCPRVKIFAFDMWVKDYGHIENPGPAFVQNELKKVDYQGTIHFINGNSHETLGRFLKIKNRIEAWQKKIPLAPTHFDLILIDGDHSILGAYQDLTEAMPRCAIGGAIVFDDIKPDLENMNPKSLALIKEELGDDPYNWESLLGVWEVIKQKFPNFVYFDYLENSPGVGIGIRVS